MEPLFLQMGVSLIQIFILAIVAMMSALHSQEQVIPLNTPVSGNWSDWEVNTTCSVTCGGGYQVHLRECDSPAPLYGGKSCPGASLRVIPCNTSPCPINGNWSPWLDNSTCTVTCGEGIRTLFRSCDNPPPANGGNTCQGAPTMTVPCNTNTCPVHGGWSGWTTDYVCPVTCGGGLTVQVRGCTNPSPTHCGNLCQGSSFEIAQCNTQPCPIDGGLSDWEVATSCSASCGGGTYTMKRTCTNPNPQYGGKDCVGDLMKTLPCNTSVCPVDGNWGEWNDVTPCSATCGTGGIVQQRVCNNPSPTVCGKFCPGPASQILACNYSIPCPACKTDAYVKDDGSSVCGSFLAQSIDWNSAKAGCEYLGSRLPEMKSLREYNDIVAKKPPGSSMWIGIQDFDSFQKWVWDSDDSLVSFFMWDGGQPNNFGGNQQCVYMQANNMWNDFACATKFVAMCEFVFPH